MNTHKPYFLNLRHSWEFPFYKQVIWKVFGEKVVECSDEATVTAYTLFNITYVSSVEL